jgi:hypothetical protein
MQVGVRKRRVAMSENEQIRFTVSSDLVKRSRALKAALGVPGDTYAWSVIFGVGVNVLEESIRKPGLVTVGSEEHPGPGPGDAAYQRLADAAASLAEENARMRKMLEAHGENKRIR